jgi:hypothetical protein
MRPVNFCSLANAAAEMLISARPERARLEAAAPTSACERENDL